MSTSAATPPGRDDLDEALRVLGEHLRPLPADHPLRPAVKTLGRALAAAVDMSTRPALPPSLTDDGVDVWKFDARDAEEPFELTYDATSRRGPVLGLDGRPFGLPTARFLHDALGWIIEQHGGKG